MKVAVALHNCYRQMAKSPTLVRACARLAVHAQRVVQYGFGNTFYTANQADARFLGCVGPQVKKFVDVGANVGQWTAELLKHATQVEKGVLFEPGSQAFGIARDRYKGDSRVCVVRAAVGDREGTAILREAENAGETSSLVAGVTVPSASTVEVRIVTLPTALDELSFGIPDLLKVDVEGFDLDVLRGAESLIRTRQIRWIQFEYNTHWQLRGSTLHAAAHLLEASGYELFLLTKDGLHKANVPLYGEYFAYSNYVACSKEGLAQIRPLMAAPM